MASETIRLTDLESYARIYGIAPSSIAEKIKIIEATPEEREDNDEVNLARIAFEFDRRHYGRLRQLIEVLNGL